MSNPGSLYKNNKLFLSQCWHNAAWKVWKEPQFSLSKFSVQLNLKKYHHTRSSFSILLFILFSGDTRPTKLSYDPQKVQKCPNRMTLSQWTLRRIVSLQCGTRSNSMSNHLKICTRMVDICRKFLYHPRRRSVKKFPTTAEVGEEVPTHGWNCFHPLNSVCMRKEFPPWLRSAGDIFKTPPATSLRVRYPLVGCNGWGKCLWKKS